MKLTYRPEIDGLRAIAILLVIFYHAELTIFEDNIFQSGFIGVDIFFVISGYLITSIILKELLVSNKFSFGYFYERRARRLLPALFFVMLLTFPLAWLYLLPGDFLDYSKSILYSIGFSSNFYFHFSGLEYGATDSLYKPFLHTWSLSVEEQYYIIFPILLILCFKFLKNYILIILTIFLILSLLVAEWGSKSFPSATFYFLHSRMWELLAGSILAYLEIYKNIKIKNIYANNLGTLFGASLIIFFILFYTKNLNHPSLITFIPVLGVCFIIFFSNKHDYVTRILSSKLFVGTGLISYSLYLWHFPIFAFARVKDNTPSEYDKFEWIALTFVLSIITYFCVEKFFKNKIAITKNRLIFFLSSILFLVLILNFYTIYKKGFSYKYRITENYTLDKSFYLDKWTKFNEKIGMPKFDDSNKTKILIVGNSHANDTFNSFYLNKELFDSEQFSIVNVHVACFYYFLKNKNSLPLYCEQVFNDKDFSLIKNLFLESDLVVISTRWSEDDINTLENLIKVLKDNKKRIVLFNSSPETNTKIRREFNILDFFVFRNNRLPDLEELDNIESEMFKQIRNREKVNKKLKKISETTNIKMLLKEQFLCNVEKKRCSVMTDNEEKIFWDYAHYTLEGAKYLGKKIYETKWFSY